MGTPYSRGYSFERRVRWVLEDQGWVTFRAAGSRGPVDLVALKREKDGKEGLRWS